MDALLMCGGRGTRLGGETEKPLTPIGGRPMVDRVLDALAESRVGTTHAVVSPHASETREHLAEIAAERPDVRLIDAPGDGYVADLRYALTEVEAVDPPVLTVAADLPLLDGEAVDVVLDAARKASAGAGSLTVCVPAERKRALGVSADAATEIDGREVVPAGINVAEGGSVRSDDGRGGDDDPDGAADENESAAADEDESAAANENESAAADEDDEDGVDERDDGGAVYCTDDVRFAVNVNYPPDVEVAERLLTEGIADAPTGDSEAPDGDADDTHTDP